jgi:hypothetical protein
VKSEVERGAEWQLQKHVWGRRAFYRTCRRLLFHIPIGTARAIRKGMDGIKAKGYTVEVPYVMLQDETGPFSADMLIALKETPENGPNVVIWEGATLCSRYHGPFEA